MTSSWSFSVSPWTIPCGVLYLLALLWLAARSIRRNPRSVRFACLEAMKFLIGCLLFLTLLQPEAVRVIRKTERPAIAVLCDASDSMNTRDVVVDRNSCLSRAEWLAKRREAAFWAPLEKNFKVVVTDFAAPPEKDKQTASDDPGTDIDLALEEAAKRYNNLRAVLLISDGDWNMGRSPVSAATRLRMNGTAVFAVTVGSDKFLPDLELRNIVAPAYGLLDERVAVAFTVQSRLDRDVKTTVSLLSPGGLNATKDIFIPAMAQVHESILLIPETEGEHTYTLKLPVEADEVFKDNNSKEFRIALRRELLKVLVVESTPRWEYRFLHNALSRDPGVSVKCLLLHPGMGAGEGRDNVSSFPAGMDTLSQYDVVFLGDIGVGQSELSLENVEMLKGLVEQQGSGLVFLPGMRGRQASLIPTALGDMMPVEMDPSKPTGFGAALESQLVLTARGSGHLLTMLSSTPAGNAVTWRNLPGFYWHAPVMRAKTGSEVLAVHSVARNEYGRIPLLVTRNFGSGKVLFMGTDGAWRWRRGVEDTYHYRFWGQVVRWMAHQRHLAHKEGIRFFFSPELPSRGDKVFLHATVYDKAGYPMKEGAPVLATVAGPSGYAERIELSHEPGGWGVFRGAFVPPAGGEYDVAVRCEEAERQVSAKIVVSSPRREVCGRPAREQVMSEIASITRGKHGTAADLDAIVKDIALLPEPEPMEMRLRLWCHPLWAGFIVFLLASYWIGRKLMGLV